MGIPLKSVKYTKDRCKGHNQQNEILFLKKTPIELIQTIFGIDDHLHVLSKFQ